MLIMLFLPLMTHAQSLERMVLGASGQHTEAGEWQLSWHVGEVMTATYQQDDYQLTQGFLQGEVEVSTLIEAPQLNAALKVFPNPAANLLIIVHEVAHQTYRLIDLQGRIMRQFTAESYPYRLDISELPAGIYMLQTGNQQTHRIIKH